MQLAAVLHDAAEPELPGDAVAVGVVRRLLPGRAVQRVVVDRGVQRQRTTRRALAGAGLHHGEPGGKAGVRRSSEPHRGWIQRRATEPP